MPIITVEDLHIRYRGPALLDGVNCRIDTGERIGLLGRNGAGKTTFLKLLGGAVEPDSGSVLVDSTIRIALLPQEVPRDMQGRSREIIAQGVSTLAGESERWLAQQQVEQVASRMELDLDAPFEELSSGMKRRVLLAQAIVSEPDVLLLDEPTNHLDISSILWLEKFLQRWSGTILFVTHDRVFLQNVATRILEIDRGALFDWSCDYLTFLKRKELALAAEEKQAALFDKKLADEERWIRQGIKARRTRNEGRVRALQKMRRERSERRADPGLARIRIEHGQRSGYLVAQLDHVSFGYGDQSIVHDFSTTILRGDKVGLIGPNGVGKTTLLKLLLGSLSPRKGSVRLGTNLQVAYFDQLRQELNETGTVQENVGDGYDTVSVGDAKTHILGYLQNFLFSAERARTEVRFLSGGERNRVLLAKLFTKPANVIVLDEPTNDLDSETLELLEQRLVEFPGTVLLVSHDRSFLNNVATSTIVFENGEIREYVGGYDDWLRQRPEPVKLARKESPQQEERSSESNTTPPPAKRRLKFKEAQELKELPAAIDQLEQAISSYHNRLLDPGFFQQASSEISQHHAELKDLESRLDQAYQRWQALEDLSDEANRTS